MVDWGQAAGGGTSIDVRCYGPDGRTVQENFSLAYAVGYPFGIVPGVRTLGAWALANDPTSTNVYTPELGYQYNGFGTGHLTAQKTGTGQYTVTIPGTLVYTSSVALVTAYGTNSNYCNIASWTKASIDVACYDTDTEPADTVFDVTLHSGAVTVGPWRRSRFLLTMFLICSIMHPTSILPSPRLLRRRGRAKQFFYQTNPILEMMGAMEPKLTHWLLIRCRNRESSQPRRAELAVFGRFRGSNREVCPRNLPSIRLHQRKAGTEMRFSRPRMTPISGR